jgi:hypothetical protein
MKRIEIKPFQSVGEFQFNEKRENLLPKINFKLRGTREDADSADKFIIDDYAEVLAYYNQLNERLFYVLFAPLPTYELIFQGQNLFKLNSSELFDYFSELDDNLYIEDYVGFGSTKFGIDFYTPDFTEDKSAPVQGISIAIKGYFDAVTKGEKLDLTKLQEEQDVWGARLYDTEESCV